MLAVFYVPLFFVLVRKLFKERGRHADAGNPPGAEAWGGVCSAACCGSSALAAAPPGPAIRVRRAR
ncbi:hypothetical protein PPH41_39730, partial [Burkholderia gladioli]|nr:hypothetical protein [Burkholderia gladioli]